MSTPERHPRPRQTPLEDPPPRSQPAPASTDPVAGMDSGDRQSRLDEREHMLDAREREVARREWQWRRHGWGYGYDDWAGFWWVILMIAILVVAWWRWY